MTRFVTIGTRGRSGGTLPGVLRIIADPFRKPDADGFGQVKDSFR
jgi:hypothetical protein